MKKQTEQQFSTWAEKINKSDQRAFDELFRSFYPILVRFVMRYVTNTTTSKDIVQGCFVTLWQTRQRLDASRSLKSYLYMMVRNRALNEIIRDKRRSHTDLQFCWIQCGYQEDHNFAGPERSGNY